MSIFGKIASAIFGTSPAAAASPAAGTPAGIMAPAAGGTSAAATPISMAQVETMIATLAGQQSEQFNWKQSIVDLMKLLKLDSSLNDRKELAKELGYTGALDGSAEMNIWLHQQVMEKLAASGGVVPDSLKG